MWKNKVEHICRGVLDQADFWIVLEQECQLNPLKATLERIAELAQLVEGFELETS